MRKIILILFIVFSFSGFTHAEELVTSEAVNYFNDGLKAQEAGKYDEAIAFYQKALIVDPTNKKWQVYIINNYGIMYLKLGDIHKAEFAFNDALKIDPNYQPAKLNLGLIYDFKKDRLKSLEYWLKIFNINVDELKPKEPVLATVKE